QKLSSLYSYQLLPDRRMMMRPIDLDNVNFKRLWIITSSWDMDRSLGMDAEGLLNQLREGYTMLSSHCQDGVCLDLFTR
ncbi:MAG: hypothetical protein WC450_12445, partial [Candidatus Omnitrophota bacterium]